MICLKGVCIPYGLSCDLSDIFSTVSSVEWGQQCNAAYESLMAGVDKDDTVTRTEIMTPILAELAERDVKGSGTCKSVSSMMRSALRQFSSLVSFLFWYCNQ